MPTRISAQIVINNVRYKAHRVIMTRHLGRDLLANEVVYHIDRDKKNNSIDNLGIYSLNKASNAAKPINLDKSKPCKRCKTPFTPNLHRINYCSTTCRKAKTTKFA